MSVRFLAVASLTALSFAPATALAAKVCVEEVAGVCLKYEERAQPQQPVEPQAPPAAREEQALGLSASDRRTAQRGLGVAGYYSGVVDGALGPRSRRSISEWQSAKGYAPTGYLTRDQFALLESIAPPPPPSAAAQPAPAAPEPEPTQTAGEAPVFKQLDGPEQPSPTAAAAQPAQPQPKFKVLTSPSGSGSSATR